MDFQTALDNFVNQTQNKYDDYCKKNLTNLWNENLTDKFVAEQGGTKYIRIVRVGPNNSSRSAHCFIKKDDGTIWKCASWKAPAKNFSRGSIFSENLNIALYGY